MKLITIIISATCLLLITTKALADEPRVIQVSALAEKSITPDMVHISVDIWSKGTTAEKTQSLAAQRTKQARAVFDQFKIKKEDIQTQSYSFAPDMVWDNKTNQNKMVGFRSNQNFKVTLRNTADLGPTIDSLTRTSEKPSSSAEAGVNIGALTWDSSKRDEVELATLTEAVKVSKKRADEIAKAAQVKIKGVFQMSHQMTGAEQQPIPMAKSMSFRSQSDALTSSTTVSEGQIKVVVSVSAAYEIQ